MPLVWLAFATRTFTVALGCAPDDAVVGDVAAVGAVVLGGTVVLGGDVLGGDVVWAATGEAEAP